ncbi:hypothetical protein [Aquimarina rubra]|uniref:Uncharacterized protein n=1 Tax=Aquimarina rubra TaxID=1920033 RepID=A0ABW5LJH8_9FLAO
MSKIQITPEKVDFGTDQVSIKDSSLLTKLVVNQNETVEFIKSEIPQFSLDDITIDDVGIITIKNPEFSEALRAKFENFNPLAAVKNGVCGAGC